LQDLTVISNRL